MQEQGNSEASTTDAGNTVDKALARIGERIRKLESTDPKPTRTETDSESKIKSAFSEFQQNEPPIVE